MSDTLMTWANARQRAADAEALPPEHVALADALGAVLAEEVRAPVALPAFDTAAMDGYAVAGRGPWRLRGAILAGENFRGRLGSGDAVEIATGAQLPADAQGVLRYERATCSVDGLVHGSMHENHDVRRAGSDLDAGTVLLPRGAVITTTGLGLLAGAGIDVVSAHPRPLVNVVISGNELCDHGLPGTARVRDALGPLLPGLVTGLGGELVAIAWVSDTEDAIVEAIAANSAHVHVVTGSTSVGRADHLHKALATLGAELIVDGVACRPGHPQMLARLAPTAMAPAATVIGLPGNPLAAVVAAATLLGPRLAALRGCPAEPPLRVAAPDNVHPAPGWTTLTPVRWNAASGVSQLPRTSSASLLSAAQATHLAATEHHCAHSTLIPLPTGITS